MGGGDRPTRPGTAQREPDRCGERERADHHDPAVTTLPHDACIRDAVDVIVGKKIGGLPIVDKDGVLAGIVTERDVLQVLGSERSSLRVEDVMSSSTPGHLADRPI